MDLVKCKICRHKISEVDIKEHLRSCINNVDFGALDQLYFIKDYLGDKEIIIYINGFREDALESLFSPMEFKVSPVSYSIYNITDSIINGLQSNDPEFYDETLRLLWSFFNDLSRLITGDRNDYYLASLLELFNEIYEKQLEHKLKHRVSNLNDSFERVVNKYKDKVIYCYYKLGGIPHWRNKIHFLDDTGFFSQEFIKVLKSHRLEGDFDKSPITKDFLKKIISTNLQKRDIEEIFPRVKYLFVDESHYFDDFKLRLEDFLEYIIDSEEAKAIRKIPMKRFNLGMAPKDRSIINRGDIIFNENRHVISFEKRGYWDYDPDVRESFPESIINLKHLQELDLSGKKIRDIPSSIDKLSQLKCLNLTRNEIPSLPKSIGNLKNLKILNMSENRLRSLPKSIGNLKSLEELSLEQNNFRFLPKSIASLESLEWLLLQDNKLKKLPNSLKNLTKLTHIYLNNNQLRKFPEVLSNLHALEEISLSDNDLETIPEWLLNLKSLRRIFVENTKIKTIPESLKEQKFIRIVL